MMHNTRKVYCDEMQLKGDSCKSKHNPAYVVVQDDRSALNLTLSYLLSPPLSPSLAFFTYLSPLSLLLLFVFYIRL